MLTSSLLTILLLELSAGANYADLKAQGERHYARGSYQRAHEIYLEADQLKLPRRDALWVDFRVADTLWRAQAGAKTSDYSKYDRAQNALRKLLGKVTDPKKASALWAKVQESLGDFHWTREDSKRWYQAWRHYEKALVWWERYKSHAAKAHFLAIVFRCVSPPWRDRGYYYGYHGNYLPIAVVEKALRLAQSGEQRSRVHFILAMTIRNQGGSQKQRACIQDEFEAALDTDKKSDWYDDALYHYGQQLESPGRMVKIDNTWKSEPDFIKALALYRRLRKEFKEGESRYWDDARRRIDAILQIELGVSVSNIFLPGSEIQLHVTWKNLKQYDLAIYSLDLPNDIQLKGSTSASSWLSTIDLTGKKKVQGFSKATGDQGDHRPGRETIRLQQKLDVGAYLVEVVGNKKRRREFLLLTEDTVVLKSAPNRVTAYVCDAMSGAPRAASQISFWIRQYDGNYKWTRINKRTNREGLASVPIPLTKDSSSEIFVATRRAAHQAFASAHAGSRRSDSDSWRIYAFTDRPVYRPKDTVYFKFIARLQTGFDLTTPSGRELRWRIDDPRSSKVVEGQGRLNAFGSIWGQIELTESMPLGEYRVTFRDDRNTHIGYATLFRLEEYKLPEYVVRVSTPEDKQTRRPKTFRPGEKVEVEVRVKYYYGGAVTGADVDVTVQQSTFRPFWQRAGPFPWLDTSRSPGRRPRYRGYNQILHKQLKTDTKGIARFSFDTPTGTSFDGSGYKFSVRARVIDSSRREVFGSGMVHATRYSYYVYADSKHLIHKPGASAEVRFKVLDAQNLPVRARGKITVERAVLKSTWVDEHGRKADASRLEKARQRDKTLQPAGWQQRQNEVEYQLAFKTTIMSDVRGKAPVSFAPKVAGYYRVSWDSRPPRSDPVHAETFIYVADRSTTDLEYQRHNLAIFLDRKVVEPGTRVPVLISSAFGNRWVLFSIEGDELHSTHLVHMQGPVALTTARITDAQAPNVFLKVVSVAAAKMHSAEQQITVPPLKQFLDIKVKTDKPVYRPRDSATVTVTAHDRRGKPARAEVALGLVDESIYTIQSEYAQDPRQFFHNQRRSHRVRTGATFLHKSYARLVENTKGGLIDARQLARQRAQEIAARRQRPDPTPGPTEDQHPPKNGSGVLAVTADRMDTGARLEEAMAAPDMEKSMVRLSRRSKAKKKMGSGGGAAKQEAPVQVRTDFRATALWQADALTNAQGRAVLRTKMPDTMTSWRATARAITRGAEVGIGTSQARTRQPLIVRLQGPRFFVVGDKLLVSAITNNNTDQSLSATVVLEEQGGLTIEGVVTKTGLESSPKTTVNVPAGGEARVDWQVVVQEPGETTLKVTSRGGREADAMEKTFRVYPHGIEKMIARGGKLRSNKVRLTIDLPKRRPGSTTMTVQLTPSQAVTMLDALPYLIDYPYGCTEQTMSRFLPAVIVKKTLTDLGLSTEAIAYKMFGGIESAHAKKTHGKGKRDMAELDAMVKRGLSRLYDFQHADGGWGWWKSDKSDRFMSAYVLWGLTLASEAGVSINSSCLSRAAGFIDKNLVEEELAPNRQAWLLHATSAHRRITGSRGATAYQKKAFDNLWKKRSRLSAYGRALLTLSAVYLGKKEPARILVENLDNGVVWDKEADTSAILKHRLHQPHSEEAMDTAHWGESRNWWHWFDGGVETTAFVLKALLAVDKKHRLIEPASNWLVKNRRGAQWSNTRDTALVLLALSDYLKTSGELGESVEYELRVNGKLVARKKISKKTLLSAPSTFSIKPSWLKDGENEIIIEKRRGQALYFFARADFFSLEEPIKAAGNELFVHRQYFRLPEDGKSTAAEPLYDNQTIQSGQRVEVVLTIETKNDYEYLVFEDLKPAGFEATEVKSGQPMYARELQSSSVDNASRFWNQKSVKKRTYSSRSAWVYQELRDRKVTLFVGHLPQGIWELRYQLRAEIPGRFHGLPTLGHAMYVPEIRCNSDEIRVEVLDR